MITKSDHFVINNSPVCYEVFGSGPQPILLIPGSIGTPKTDYFAQVEGLNALDLTKFTLVGVELPGWGRSRPPKRAYGSQVYKNDVDCCQQLMKLLGHSLFSVIGWSDGCNSALGLAIQYPSRIDKVVVLAPWTNVKERNLQALLSTKDINTWEKTDRENYTKVYGADEMQTLWSEAVKFFQNIKNVFPGDVFDNQLKTIQCPVLVMHGELDPLIEIEQSVSIAKQIGDCKLERFASGGHYLHQQYPEKFKILIEDFMDE